MKEGKIRKATKKDVSKMTKLFNSDPKNLFGDSKSKFYKEDIEDYLKKRLNKMIVYEKNNQVAGVLLAEFWEGYVYLHILVIDKKYQGQGIGTKLIDHLEKLAIKEKKYAISLFTEIHNKKMQEILKKRKYNKGNKFIFYNKKIR